MGKQTEEKIRTSFYVATLHTQQFFFNLLASRCFRSVITTGLFVSRKARKFCVTSGFDCGSFYCLSVVQVQKKNHVFPVGALAGSSPHPHTWATTWREATPSHRQRTRAARETRAARRAEEDMSMRAVFTYHMKTRCASARRCTT